MKTSSFMSPAHLVIAVAMAVVGGAFLKPVWANGSAGPEVIANANGFACSIPGCADASKNIREIAIDELNIDVRETTTGLDVEYKTYQPGKPVYGNATFTSEVLPGGSKELQAWFQEVSRGKNIRKNITVTLFKSDKTPGRSYSLFDCFPTQWSQVDLSAAGGVQTETLTVKIGRIELVTFAAPPPSGPGRPRANARPAEAGVADKFAQVRGFKVEISGSSGKEVDTAWESVHGGELVFALHPKPETLPASKYKSNSPGHKSVGEVTLKGAMTDSRKALCQWINDTVNGKPWKRIMTVTESLFGDGSVKPGKTYHYFDGFPVRYVFPRMSVTNTTGNVEEEVTMKFVRMERSLPPRCIGKITMPGLDSAATRATMIWVEDMGFDLDLIATQQDARNLSAVVAIAGTAGPELLDWMDQTNQGMGTPKTFTLDLYSQRRATGRQVILENCLPQSVTTSGGGGGSGGLATTTLEVRMDRIEMK